MQKGSTEATCTETIIIAISTIIIILLLPLSIWFCFKVVPVYQRMVIFRCGRLLYDKPKGPGLIFVNCITDDTLHVDLRVRTYEIPTQEILTADAVTVRVDAVIYFKVFNPMSSILAITEYEKGTNLLSASVLRNEFGTKGLTEVLSERESISMSMQRILDETTHKWGVMVERVEIKDVSLPPSMQRAMAAEGEATREARAKIIAADGELNASKALKEASDIMASNPAALQLRYLQTLASVQSERTETFIFPLPTDFLRR